MTMRLLCALALLVSAIAVPVATAQPALAITERDIALTNVDTLLHKDFNGSTFNLAGDTCPKVNDGGNCWWWAANAWMALITWADENPGTSNRSTIETDLLNTYNYICGHNQSTYSAWRPCPNGPDQNATDPFTINTNGNIYFDDIGWWETTWLAAYKLVGRLEYLNLAEELWNYVTGHGYAHAQCGGIPQYYHGDGTTGSADTFANALYLRDSAWLFEYTDGAPFSGQYMNGTNVGGAIHEDIWIKNHLIFPYNQTTPGTSGARFMMAGETDSSCGPHGTRTFLHAQGAMVSAWTEMAKACRMSGAGCGAQPSYFDNLAEELARSVIYDQRQQDGSWPFANQNVYNTTSPPQATPTVDYANGVLSEMCDSPGWPYGCNLGTDKASFASYLIAKGIFERAAYCVNSDISDSTIADFIRTNAQSIANNLTNYGFYWDSRGSNNPVNFATRASILEGVDADIGQGEANATPPDPHYGMC